MAGKRLMADHNLMDLIEVLQTIIASIKISVVCLVITLIWKGKWRIVQNLVLWMVWWATVSQHSYLVALLPAALLVYTSPPYFS